ncbi:adiponectin receptor protein 2-like [Rhagoletis pomonella]|uniref:adiponectin receptor protein 2-like n=1 Tax=Rhagoletis pomonella TaxID=28610 RepID=UPI001785D669|nr:adiponectin receptor protein 2-like [Rhagoletis pomonella]XP_036342119.1 adiponectin receptor protein 2-like [Rhagoletis pomonella]
MQQYDNVIRTQIIATCEQQTEFVQPRSGENTATCFKRKDKKLEGLKYVADTPHFPENEEPNILGHGTPVVEKSDPLVTEKLMKVKTLLDFEETLRIIYSVIALCMFGLAMLVQIPKLNVSLDAKIGVLVLWAAYGIIPLAHWTYVMGGFDNELVRLMVPRIIIMYGWCALAFVIYAAKIPERWLTGKVDYVGHSHNWWHLFILAAFYHWHNTGIVYAEYRVNNGCSLPTLT